MTETLYPMGYGTRMVTMAELRAKHEPHMHPEYARRLFAWIEACEGLIGIGGGYRELGQQPDKPGFAQEGKSFHQPQPFINYPMTFSAVDLVVVNPGGAHRAPRWSEVPAKDSQESKNRGLHCHIKSESWHMQVIEMLGWTTWWLGGRKDPIDGYVIPGWVRKVFAPKPSQEKRTKLLSFLNNKGEVAAIQNSCNWWGWTDNVNRKLLPDGQYGELTAQGVGNMQKALGVKQDGKYGPQTANAFQAFLDAMSKMPR